MPDEDPQLHDLIIDLVSSTHRFTKLATSLGSDRYPRTILRALSLLEEYGEIRISDIARIDHCSQPSATAIVRNLSERGLVERRQDPHDARAVLVDMTDLGRKTLAAGRDEIADALLPHFADLDPGQIERLTHGLTELRSMITSAGPTAL